MMMFGILKRMIVGIGVFAVLFYILAFFLKGYGLAFLLGFVVYLASMFFISPLKEEGKYYESYNLSLDG